MELKLQKNKSLEFLFIWIIFIAVLCVLQILGINGVQINNFSIFIYISFFVLIFIRDVKFVAEFSWIIIIFSMNILGVYVCENINMYLVEQQMNTSFSNALNLLVIYYILFFGAIELTRLSQKKEEIVYLKNDRQSTKIANDFILTLGLFVLCFLFIKVIDRPYFLLGMGRLVYRYDSMSGLERSLKSYLPLLIPVAVTSIKNGKKLLPFAFISVLLLYYFWTGDKFGVYFFAIYIFMMCYMIDFNVKWLRKVSIFMIFSVFILLGIVYIQKILLYQYDFSSFIEYLFQRLSNQGGTWYGVYTRYKGMTPHFHDFSKEIFGILPGTSMNEYDLSQWKMMLASSGFSSYARYRIDALNPYTATTTASLYYYFGGILPILFYLFMGVVYSKYVTYMRTVCGKGILLESIISVKILECFHSMLTASDLYLVSYKGLIYIGILIVLIVLRKKQIRIKFGNIMIV